MKIGVVCEYSVEGTDCFPSEESQGIIDFLSKHEDVHLLHPAHHKFSHKEYPTIRTKGNEFCTINLENLDAIYLGVMGKKQHRFEIANGLGIQLPRFCAFFETLQKMPESNIVNPLSTILENITKNYLIELTKREFTEVIPTKKVESLDELIDHSKSPQKYIAKPLISERAIGTIVINEKTAEELAEYFNKYNLSNENPLTLYDQLLNQQGIIIQPYQEGFKKSGEIKVAVVNGIPTIGRINIGSKGDLVTISNGASLEKLDYTKEEADFVKRIYQEFNKINPASYIRVDYVIEDGQFKTNEIEAINPDFATMDGIFSKEELEKHYSEILLGIYSSERASSNNLNLT